jgi:hypothetical protein
MPELTDNERLEQERKLILLGIQIETARKECEYARLRVETATLQRDTAQRIDDAVAAAIRDRNFKMLAALNVTKTD